MVNTLVAPSGKWKKNSMVFASVASYVTDLSRKVKKIRAVRYVL